MRKLGVVAAAAAVNAAFAAQAGSPGLQFVEPVVANFRTVATELLAAQSLMYVGINGNSQSMAQTGRLTSYLGTQPFALNFPAGSSGYTGGLVVGARRSAMGFLFGAEMFHNAAAEPSSETASFTYSIISSAPRDFEVTQSSRIGGDTGLRFLFGRDFEGMRFYGGLGVASARATTQITVTDRGEPEPTEYPARRRSLVGTQMALGMELQTTEFLSLRMEMSQTRFRGFSYDLSNSATGFDSVHSFRPTVRRFTVGAILEF